MPVCVETNKKNLLQNQKAIHLETWYAASATQDIKFVQMMTRGKTFIWEKIKSFDF